MSDDEGSTDDYDPYYVMHNSGDCDASASTITMSEADFESSRQGSVRDGFDMSLSTMEGITLSQEPPRFKRSWDPYFNHSPLNPHHGDLDHLEGGAVAIPKFEEDVPTRPLEQSDMFGDESSPSFRLQHQQQVREAPSQSQGGGTYSEIVEKLKESTRTFKPGAVAVSQTGDQVQLSPSQQHASIVEKLKERGAGGGNTERPGAIAISQGGEETPRTSQYSSTAVEKLKEAATGGKASRPGAVAITEEGEEEVRSTSQYSSTAVEKLKEAATGGKASRPGAVAITEEGEEEVRSQYSSTSVEKLKEAATGGNASRPGAVAITEEGEEEVRSQYSSTAVEKLKEAATGGKASRPGVVAITEGGEVEARFTSQRPLSMSEKLKESCMVGPAVVPGAVAISIQDDDNSTIVQKLKTHVGLVDTIPENQDYDVASTVPDSIRSINVQELPNTQNTRMMSSSFSGFPTNHRDDATENERRPNSARDFPTSRVGADSQVGAVAVAGVDAHQEGGQDEEDNLIFGEHATSEPTTEHLVEAQPITGDDEVGSKQEEEDDVENRVVAAKPVPDEELERSSPIGWLRRHKSLLLVSFIVVIAAVLSSLFTSGSSDGATSGGGGGGPRPIQLSNRFREAMPTVTTVTPEEILLNPYTPQYNALKWLSDEDAAQIEFSKENSRVLQRYALAVLYYATKGQGWSNEYNFLSIINECDWTGTLVGDRAGVVSCSEEGFVTSLILAQNDLNGTLPEEIGSLDSLEVLNLSNNPFLYGTLPDSLSALTNLKDIRASNCYLYGTLPEIGNWNGVSYLTLQENLLSGSLPQSLGRLTLLESLFLSSNRFTGQIPREMGSLVNLRVAYLQNNQLSGSIPVELSNLEALRHIDMSSNLLVEGGSNLCDIDGLLVYVTDCYSQRVPLIEKEITCPCCSLCCSHQIIQGCTTNPDIFGIGT